MSTHVPGFHSFFSFFHDFVLAKLAISSKEKFSPDLKLAVCFLREPSNGPAQTFIMLLWLIWPIQNNAKT